MVTVLDSGLRDWAWVIALCPWPRAFSPSPSLLVYQCVLENPILGVILGWITFLSRGKEVILHSLLLEVKGTTLRFAGLEKFSLKKIFKLVVCNSCQSFFIPNHPCFFMFFFHRKLLFSDVL